MSLSFRTLLFTIACVTVFFGASSASLAQEQPASAPGVSQPVSPDSPVAAAPQAEPQKAAPAGPVVTPSAAEAKAPDAAPVPQLPPARRADAPPKAASASTEAPYVIGPLDVLSVRVWGNQNLSGFVDVRPDGMISMSLIGELKADGLTVAQLREALTTRLEDFLNKPEVDVQVAKINSKRYYIFGEVGRPGEFPLVASTTVLDALSGAGGFRDFANQKKIYILRGTRKLFFNYKEVSNGKRMEQNIKLQNGDRIFVP